ncbi:hypothetical protein HALLA_03220 (plasmid) [Halostagnicola larsenii XH-48]|uniref:Uncharacterized protein n=1 Tax=Halostagnicola larsenii XH-48 TaxID=797299 RepID=W0JRS0_9EURY|nr:hypothetical protein HALLA_03220 [Halostagnicola larsenii XH-48]
MKYLDAHFGFLYMRVVRILPASIGLVTADAHKQFKTLDLSEPFIIDKRQQWRTNVERRGGVRKAID